MTNTYHHGSVFFFVVKAGNAASGKGTLVAYVIEIYLADKLVALGYLIPDQLFIFVTRCRGW